MFTKPLSDFKMACPVDFSTENGNATLDSSKQYISYYNLTNKPKYHFIALDYRKTKKRLLVI